MLRLAVTNDRQIASAAELPIRGGVAAGSQPEQCLKRRRRCPAPVVAKDELVKLGLQLCAAHPVVAAAFHCEAVRTFPMQFNFDVTLTQIDDAVSGLWVFDGGEPKIPLTGTVLLDGTLTLQGQFVDHSRTYRLDSASLSRDAVGRMAGNLRYTLQFDGRRAPASSSFIAELELVALTP